MGYSVAIDETCRAFYPGAAFHFGTAAVDIHQGVYNQKQQLAIRMSRRLLLLRNAVSLMDVPAKETTRSPGCRAACQKSILKVTGRGHKRDVAGANERSDMEVHQLRYFCAIVSHGTFTRAAKAEHVSQPSLSQQIMKLEDELGGRLFYRLPRTTRLTPLGEIFLPRALAVLQQIREGKAEARKIMELQRVKPAAGSIPIQPLCENDTLTHSDRRLNALSKTA